ncbi:hypothetical protein FQA47_019876 [Oryzias melastigma]|uniref:Uncharacterized protein n=1 Tax=Oryzias melastigma TaxID=30732 RepID=A0A834C9C9_ORYME|nr:hypothetical protein FQA47_019876 [Oryzias melastigma]
MPRRINSQRLVVNPCEVSCFRQTWIMMCLPPEHLCCGFDDDLAIEGARERERLSVLLVASDLEENRKPDRAGCSSARMQSARTGGEEFGKCAGI